MIRYIHYQSLKPHAHFDIVITHSNLRFFLVTTEDKWGHSYGFDFCISLLNWFCYMTKIIILIVVNFLCYWSENEWMWVAQCKLDQCYFHFAVPQNCCCFFFFWSSRSPIFWILISEMILMQAFMSTWEILG